jgi:hypothetical protein
MTEPQLKKELIDYIIYRNKTNYEEIYESDIDEYLKQKQL